MLCPEISVSTSDEVLLDSLPPLLLSVFLHFFLAVLPARLKPPTLRKLRFLFSAEDLKDLSMYFEKTISIPIIQGSTPRGRAETIKGSLPDLMEKSWGKCSRERNDEGGKQNA